jgi:hypothetical protein
MDSNCTSMSRIRDVARRPVNVRGDFSSKSLASPVPSARRFVIGD